MPDQTSPEQATTPDPAPADDQHVWPGYEHLADLHEQLTDVISDHYPTPDHVDAQTPAGTLAALLLPSIHAKVIGLVADEVNAWQATISEEGTAELARVRPVVDAARAVIYSEVSFETLRPLADAVAGLDGDAAATPQPADQGETAPDEWKDAMVWSAGPPDDVVSPRELDVPPEWIATVSEHLDRCDDAGQAIVYALSKASMCWDRPLDAGRQYIDHLLVLGRVLDAHIRGRRDAEISSAPPVDVTARLAEATEVADAENRPIARGVLEGITELLEGAARHGQLDYVTTAIVRALATPTTDTPGGDR